MNDYFLELLKEDGHDPDRTLQDLINSAEMGYEEAFDYIQGSPGEQSVLPPRLGWLAV